MPQPDTPRWQNGNLLNHHQKRIRKDDDCWRDILDITHSMTMQQYANESYASYETAVLEYEATELSNPRRVYRIDKRTIKTISNLERDMMVTCYHEHYDRPHSVGTPAQPLVENTLRYLRTLENRAAGKVIDLYRVKLLKENIKKSKHRARKSPLVQKTESIRKNHIKMRGQGFNATG